jgi:hypothetical protein
MRDESCNGFILQLQTDGVLVAQDDYRIEQFVRQANGRWLLTETRLLEGVAELETIECKLLLREVYDKVPMP